MPAVPIMRALPTRCATAISPRPWAGRCTSRRGYRPRVRPAPRAGRNVRIAARRPASLAATLAGRRLPFSIHRPGRGAGRCPGRPTKGSGMTENALLLLNLGSPDSTRVEDVRRYLDQFLMDPYVVDLPWLPRRLLVSLILIKRPAESAHAYSLDLVGRRVATDRLSRRLQEAMKPHWPHGPVELAMRYGQPAIEKVLLDLARRGIRRVTLAPLYPQFADSTTTTAEQEVRRVIAAHRLGLEVSTLPPFYDQPVYPRCPGGKRASVPAAAPRPSVAELPWLARAAHPQAGEGSCPRPAGREQPQRQPRSPRPATAASACAPPRPSPSAPAWSRALVGVVPVAPGARQADRALYRRQARRTGAARVKRLLVMCPAFVADRIETLEEIGMRPRAVHQCRRRGPGADSLPQRPPRLGRRPGRDERALGQAALRACS